jgi:hypothetical protein
VFSPSPAFSEVLRGSRHDPQILLDPETRVAVRIRTAECIMEQASKAMEVEDIAARVAALEAATGGPETS